MFRAMLKKMQIKHPCALPAPFGLKGAPALDPVSAV